MTTEIKLVLTFDRKSDRERWQGRFLCYWYVWYFYWESGYSLSENSRTLIICTLNNTQVNKNLPQNLRPSELCVWAVTSVKHLSYTKHSIRGKYNYHIWLWARYVTFISPSFFICGMRHSKFNWPGSFND